jgi:excisionase family DNA binding protein
MAGFLFGEKRMTRLLTVDEFAKLTGYKPATVRMKIWRKEWPCIRLGRSIRLEEETLNKLLEASKKR